MTDRSIRVNVGNGRVSSLIWTGASSPASYDNTLWRDSSSQILPGTLILGDDGARISSGANVINFIAANGDEYLIQGVKIDTARTEDPLYWQLGAIVNATYSSVSDTDLAAPQELTLGPVAVTSSSWFISLVVVPHEVGELVIEAWEGDDDTGAKILDFTQTIAGGDVGNQTTLTLPNKVLLLAASNTFFRFSGVGLSGGTQTSGPFNGQSVLSLRTTQRVANQVEYLLSNESNIALTEDGATGTAAFVINSLFGDEKVSIEYNNAAFADEINVDLAEDTTVDVDADLIIEAVSHLLRSTRAATQAGFSLSQTGAEGATIQVFVGSEDPAGSQSANPGDIFIRGEAGVASDILQNRGASNGNTTWQSVFTGGGGGGGTPRTDEEIQDIVGAMVSGNTETGITVTYDDESEKLNFAVGAPAGADENFYQGLSDSDNPADIPLASLTELSVGTGAGQSFSFSVGPATASQYVILLAPTDHEISSLINIGTGFEALNSFTKTENVRTEGAVTYDSYVLGPLVATFTASYRATLA